MNLRSLRYVKSLVSALGIFVAAVAVMPKIVSAAGCSPVVVSSGSEYVLTFSNTSTCDWVVPAGVTRVDVLLIGGGAGGGFDIGGGGGAGGFREVSNVVTTPGETAAIVVGSGGSGDTSRGVPCVGSNGMPSSVGFASGNLSAIGGGGGGGQDGGGACATDGVTGASGGGGGVGISWPRIGGVGSYATDSDATTFGNSGGVSSPSSYYAGGGGGGAGGVGGAGSANGSGAVGGAGGVGKVSTITGTSVTYAGGGAGGFYQSGTRGLGGAGGGGAGGTNAVAPVVGTDGLGGGGGGGGVQNGVYGQGASGGSGVVIIHYLLPTAPANSSAPVITGIARTGVTLSSSTGNWSGSPTSYSYQWKRALTSGGSLIDIGGATSSTYVVSEFDVGYFIKVSVIATNTVGPSATILSSETLAVTDIAPTNSAVPVITGTTRTGATLTASNGSWTSSPTSYSYQWRRAATAGGSYSDISSATNRTYVLTDTDIDKYIKVSVTATNGIGSSLAALSAATSVVVDLADSVVPTATTPVATATGFTFTISNYSNSYTYALTTTKGSVTRSTDEITVSGLDAGDSATITIAVTRTNYKPTSKTVTGSAMPAATTTTTAAPALSIVIQAPVTTVAQGQVSVATVAPTTTMIPVLGANGLLVPTTTSTTFAPVPTKTVATTTTTTPTIVTTTTVGPPEVAKVSAGQSAVQVDGVKTDAVVTRENNQMVVTAGSLSATLSGLDEAGKTSPLDSDGNIHLAAGDVIKISVGGFNPGSLVEVWLFSTPTQLGSAVVGADGSINGLFTIPRGIKSGSHRVVISAKLVNGKSTTFTLGILVGKISQTSTLTRVLIAIPISLAIGFGFLLPTQLRRRRKSSNA